MSDLKIYPVILDTVSMMRPEIQRLERCDPDLARQMKRAVASVVLNVSEGAYSRGGSKKARYHDALGSARETLACLEVGAAMGHLQVRPEITARMRQILGTLTNLAR